MDKSNLMQSSIVHMDLEKVQMLLNGVISKIRVLDFVTDYILLHEEEMANVTRYVPSH